MLRQASSCLGIWVFCSFWKGHKKRDGDNEDDEHDDEDEDDDKEDDDDDNEDKGHLSGDWGPGLSDCSLKWEQFNVYLLFLF